MINKLIFTTLLLLLPFSIYAAQAKTPTLTDRVKGKILLRVEGKGEVWYVNPSDGKRYFLGRPADAFNLMRKLGVGITNKDLFQIQEAQIEDNVPKTNTELINRLKGKILLQVESKGEAWYVNPGDGKRYYMGRPQDAFNLMRNFGIGISDSDLFQIPRAQGYYDENETAVWKTYQNKKANFSIDYPTSWVYNEQGEPDTTLKTWVYFRPIYITDFKGFDTVNIKVYTSVDKGYKDEKAKPDAVTQEKDGLYYVINYDGFAFSPESKKVFDRMVKSFRFIK